MVDFSLTLEKLSSLGFQSIILSMTSIFSPSHASSLVVLVLAATAKHHKLSGLNSKHLFLTVLTIQNQLADRSSVYKYWFGL